jgi:hypothetical protein
VSASYDLRHTYHTWSGRYGLILWAVPAANSADIWVSSPAGTATEVNSNEEPVAPTVTIPEGFLVDGQAGPNLVIAGPPPTQMLELWSPAQQQVLATFGSLKYVDRGVVVAGNLVVWADANVLHIARGDGLAGTVVTDPPDTGRRRSPSPRTVHESASYGSPRLAPETLGPGASSPSLTHRTVRVPRYPEVWVPGTPWRGHLLGAACSSRGLTPRAPQCPWRATSSAAVGPRRCDSPGFTCR